MRHDPAAGAVVIMFRGLKIYGMALRRHAQLRTTAIYADVVGKEEQHIAARMWG